MRALILTLCLFAGIHAGPVLAHKGSDAYLVLSPPAAGSAAAARLLLDVALRDLDVMPIDLDRDGDGAVTWGEIQQAQPDLVALIRRDVGWTGCELAAQGFGLTRRPDGLYASMAFDVHCSGDSRPRPSDLSYMLLGDEDPTHRAIVRNTLDPNAPGLLLLTPRKASAAAHAVEKVGQAADSGSPRADGPTEPGQVSGFVAEGIAHILGGLDHVLFLVCLLLPAVGRRDPTALSAWRPHRQLREAVGPVFAQVTMFTLAHSVSLALASLGWLIIPSNIVEPLIAATIVVTAIDNVRPVLPWSRTAVTFAFGLVHGFGFAGALAEAGGLPPSHFAWALLQFNLGIELGQLAIVVLAMLVLSGLRNVRMDENWYARWALRGGSAVVGGFGVWWMLDRLRWVADLAA